MASHLAYFGAALVCLVVLVNTAPIPTEMVDMTYTFDNTTIYWTGPGQKKFELHVRQNGTTDDGYWFQIEEYTSSIHVGTHMDAPCHFAKGRWGVDEIPLDHLVAPAAVVDITSRAETDPDALLLVEDLERWEHVTGETLNGTIVMIRSGWGRRWPDREAFTGTAGTDISKLRYPGVSTEAAEWLANNRSIYGVGSETLSIDAGISTGFPAHRILYDKNIYGLENVANVDKLPMYGATLYVMPMKIGKASGAPLRMIATYPKYIKEVRGLVSDGDHNTHAIASLYK